MKKVAPDISAHPCFNAEASGCRGRVHLPVAPKCNIQCRYCNRKYDCVNESRPGVSSAVLSPRQALHYLETVRPKVPSLAVAGVAGPGDPFANVEETLETMSLVRHRFPDMLLCVASNGLELAPHVPALADLGCTHVSVTVNAVDPTVGEKLTAWVRKGKRVHRGRRAAEVLLQSQREAVRELKGHGLMVKINCILVPGINDHHVAEVAREMGTLGADLFNCMPLVPNRDTPFAHLEEPDEETVRRIRREAASFMAQMNHCTRCRADAVGLLGEDRSAEFRSELLRASFSATPPRDGLRPYVAVASHEGVLVNRHLGEADRLQIWAPAEGGYRLVEERPTPPRGTGDERWRTLASRLGDCRALLANAAGENPCRVLEREGLAVVVMEGLIADGLEAVYQGRSVRPLARRRPGAACSGPREGRTCGGDGLGCG
ncbi:MAG: nitrogenase cofactor biosynthesis protein NifB [Desulfacinum sp.]|jgi:nitrogen fixation protein NifB|nr:nitrogenase cofactor biosynthesis protein NifB [Desulfacinum sp.]